MKSTLRFSELTEYLPYPPSIKAKLSTVHATLIVEASKIYIGTTKQRRMIIDAINKVSYMYLSEDSIPDNWSEDHPLDNLPVIGDDTLRQLLGKLYVSEQNVNFDIPRISIDGSTETPAVASIPIVREARPETFRPSSVVDKDVVLTPKGDLYIQPPVVPQFDYEHPIVTQWINNNIYTIYPTIPTIPTKQNEISITTDVNKLTDSELLNLYPNHRIQTRASSMYESVSTMKLDPYVGLILPISQFTEDEVFDNIVKYPHLFRLSKVVDGQIQSFYTTLEIDGELYPVSDIWFKLPESKIIPYSSDFVKEYVVRRYLLERDILGVQHRYKMYGELNPFLTLFTSASDYKNIGYEDTIGIARQCVISRVSYKRSRNPILRRISEYE